MKRLRQWLKGVVGGDRGRAALSWLAASYVRLVFHTGRWAFVDTDDLDRYTSAGRPLIVAFWHSRLLMMVFGWYVRQPMAMLISRHRDGKLIAETVARFGIRTVAGSSRKGGLQALRELLAELRAGVNVGITPDGPRGPRMRVQNGVTALARMSGAAILPVAYSARRRVLFRSWDRFMLPLPVPFARGVFVGGEALEVPREADSAALESFRLELERRLNAVTAEADRRMGHPPVEPAPLPPPEPEAAETGAAPTGASGPEAAAAATASAAGGGD